jgi:hypothetical protein
MASKKSDRGDAGEAERSIVLQDTEGRFYRIPITSLEDFEMSDDEVEDLLRSGQPGPAAGGSDARFPVAASPPQAPGFAWGAPTYVPVPTGLARATPSGFVRATPSGFARATPFTAPFPTGFARATPSGFVRATPSGFVRATPGAPGAAPGFVRGPEDRPGPRIIGVFNV